MILRPARCPLSLFSHMTLQHLSKRKRNPCRRRRLPHHTADPLILRLPILKAPLKLRALQLPPLPPPPKPAKLTAARGHIQALTPLQPQSKSAEG